MSRSLIDDQTPPRGDFVRYLEQRMVVSAAALGLPAASPGSRAFSLDDRAAVRAAAAAMKAGQRPTSLDNKRGMTPDEAWAVIEARATAPAAGMTGTRVGALPASLGAILNRLGSAQRRTPAGAWVWQWGIFGAIFLSIFSPVLAGLIVVVLIVLGAARIRRAWQNFGRKAWKE